MFCWSLFPLCLQQYCVRFFLLLVPLLAVCLRVVLFQHGQLSLRGVLLLLVVRSLPGLHVEQPVLHLLCLLFRSCMPLPLFERGSIRYVPLVIIWMLLDTYS